MNKEKIVSIEQAWKMAELHRLPENTAKVIIENSLASWSLESIVSSEGRDGTEDSLLAEWLSSGCDWKELMSYWAKTAEIKDNVVWSALKRALKRGGNREGSTEEIWLNWIKKIESAWINDRKKSDFILASAINRDLLKIAEYALKVSTVINVNAAQIESPDEPWDKGRTHLGRATSVNMIELLLKAGGMPLQVVVLKDGEKVRAWDEWMAKSSSESVKKFARNLAAQNMSVNGDGGEDFWTGLKQSRKVSEKVVAIKQAAKNGLWDQNDEMGRNALMRLIMGGSLVERGVLNLVPVEQWNGVDKNGKTVEEYAWAAWRENRKTDRNMPPLRVMSGEQLANFVLDGLLKRNYFAAPGAINIDRYSPVGSNFPTCPIIEIYPIIDKPVAIDNNKSFWNVILSEHRSYEILLRAAASVSLGGRTTLTEVVSLNECMKWETSLDAAWEGGLNNSEERKKVANIGLMLSLKSSTGLGYGFEPLAASRNEQERNDCDAALKKWIDRGASIKDLLADMNGVLSSERKVQAYLTTKALSDETYKDRASAVRSLTSIVVDAIEANWIDAVVNRKANYIKECIGHEERRELSEKFTKTNAPTPKKLAL